MGMYTKEEVREVTAIKATFTGTSLGMTRQQKLTLRALLTALPITVLHHGCDIGRNEHTGADVSADIIARKAGIRTEGHPAEGKPRSAPGKKRPRPAHMYPARPPLIRNKIMVTMSDIVIATPYHDHEIRRSGTWMTVRFARKEYRPIIIIWPDGTIDGEEGEYSDQG